MFSHQEKASLDYPAPWLNHFKEEIRKFHRLKKARKVQILTIQFPAKTKSHLNQAACS